MDELDVQGKKYISSKRGAELTGYAKDYIGQLARAGKVPGTRFGRAWFVEEAALLKHLGSETQVAEVVPEVEEVSAPVLLTAPVQAKKPLLSRHMIAPTALPKTWSSVQYLHDDSELFPVVVPRVAETAVPKPVVAVVEEKKASVEVRVPVHIAPSTVAVEKRVAALVDGIRPRSAVLRVAQSSAPIVRKAVEAKKEEKLPAVPLKRSVSVHWSPGSFANAAAALILVFGSFGSFVFMNGVTFGTTENLTASAQYGLTDFLDVLKEARIADAGLETIRSFYDVFTDSFFVFLKKGADFTLSLF